jgi:PAS domain S-box-containing protein
MEIGKTVEGEMIAPLTSGTNGKTLDHIWPIIVVVDRDNRIVFINRRAKHILGLKKGDVVEKGGRYRLLPPDESDE